MATEYINKEMAKEIHCNICEFGKFCNRNDKNCEERRIFNDIPTIYMQPIINGHWDEPDDDYGYLICSNCEERAPMDISWRFCPHCGASMS